jgi:hypothetical protein
MPKPLFTKLIATLAIGFACLFVGIIYSITTKDTIFLVLSMVLFSCSLIKTLFLYLIIKRQNYFSFCGTCLEIKRNILRRTSIITFKLDDGSIFNLSLDRVMKLRKEVQYELYFEINKNSVPQQNFIDSMRFLCLEELS